jgi:MYXO-CTERM domain-containing protein
VLRSATGTTLAIALGTLCATSGLAHATYSIAAVDTATRDVGGAGTSCIGSASVRVIYGSVPGQGVVHAQAQIGGGGKASAVTQLGEGVEPTTIIATITASSFDANAQRRQYGIVDLAGRAAGFTGSENGSFADDRQGSVATFTYAVQGNIITSAAVLDQATAAFVGGGCDLPDRLMRALEAGAANGEGDSRCTVDGIPADSAFIEVDRPDERAGTYLLLEVTGTAPEDPLVLLRAKYDAWRATHPCPMLGGDDIDPGSGDDSGCCSSGRDPRDTVALAVLVLVALARRRRLR